LGSESLHYKRTSVGGRSIHLPPGGYPGAHSATYATEYSGSKQRDWDGERCKGEDYLRGFPLRRCRILYEAGALDESHESETATAQEQANELRP
jgi:hypothetical protein